MQRKKVVKPSRKPLRLKSLWSTCSVEATLTPRLNLSAYRSRRCRSLWTNADGVEHIHPQTPVDELVGLTNDDYLARYSCKNGFIMPLYRRASSLSMVGIPKL